MKRLFLLLLVVPSGGCFSGDPYYLRDGFAHQWVEPSDCGCGTPMAYVQQGQGAAQPVVRALPVSSGIVQTGGQMPVAAPQTREPELAPR